MKKRILYVTGIVSGIFTALLTLFGIIVTNKMMFIKMKDTNVVLERETIAKRFDEKWFENVKKEEIWINSPNNYNLKAIFLKPLETANTVIICHGVTENKINSMKYARLFERLGYNSVVYDHRRHGDSGGKTTSFGYYEKIDLDTIVHTIREQIGDEATLGIHGESMGAATTILYAGTFENEADFLVVDCPFSDFSQQILHILRSGTPLRTSMALRVGNVFLKMRDGYTLNRISPREVIGTIKVPMLFIHSMEDEFILPSMSEELYALKEGDNKMIKLFDKGAHAKSFNDNAIEYEEVVHEFLEKYV